MKATQMGGLTRFEIEQMRSHLTGGDSGGGQMTVDERAKNDAIHKLCDLALQSLSLESVRSEALMEAAAVCMAQKNPPRPHHQPGYVHFDPANVMADKCAAAIRALSPARVAEGDEYGWLIERFVNEHYEWFAGWNDDSHGFIPKSPKWTRDAFQAIRFNRKRDGEAIATYDGNFMHTKITDHLFMSPSSPESPAKEQPSEYSPEDRETMRRDFERSVYEREAKEQPGEQNDVSSMVKRLNRMAEGATFEGGEQDAATVREAAALLAKLGQQSSPFIINWTTEGCPKHHGQSWIMGSAPIYTEIAKRCPLCDPPPPERP